MDCRSFIISYFDKDDRTVESQNTAAKVSIRFLDEDGKLIREVKTSYLSVPEREKLASNEVTKVVKKEEKQAHQQNETLSSTELESTVLKAKVNYQKRMYATAFSYFKQAAEAGHIDSQLMLAQCYEMGRGVKKDLEQAFQWYQRAANQGDAVGLCNLGVCYDSGRGVKEDALKAASLFKEAAGKGNAMAQYYYGVCLKQGRGVLKNEKEAVFWYEKSAAQNNIRAQNALGACYEYGEGLEIDLEKAMFYYRKAASGGDNTAKNNMARLELAEAQREQNAREQAEREHQRMRELEKERDRYNGEIEKAKKGFAITLWEKTAFGSTEDEKVEHRVKGLYYPESSSVVIEYWNSKRGTFSELVKIPDFITGESAIKRYLISNGYNVD